MAFDRIPEQDFLDVTESAAVAAAQTMGFGDRERSDRVAVEAMRRVLNGLEMSLQGGIIRFVDTVRREETASPVRFR